jgi:hypothetical protein
MAVASNDANNHEIIIIRNATNEKLMSLVKDEERNSFACVYAQE